MCKYCHVTHTFPYHPCWRFSLSIILQHNTCVTRLLEHAIGCTTKHTVDEYFGRDLWIVLNETVMVVNRSGRCRRRGNVWICGMFVWSSSICSVVIVNVLVIFFSLPPSWIPSLYTKLWPQAEIPKCIFYVPPHSTVSITGTVMYTFIMAEPKCKTMWSVILHISRTAHYLILWPIVRISSTHNGKISLCERLILCASHRSSGMNTDSATLIKCEQCRRFRTFRAIEVRNMSDIATLRLGAVLSFKILYHAVNLNEVSV